MYHEREGVQDCYIVYLQDCLLFVAEVSSSLQQYVVALSFSSSHPCSPTSDPYVLSIYAISRPCIGIHQHTAVAGTLRTRLSSFWRWRRLWAYEATKLTAPWWPVVSKAEFLHMELFDYYSDPMGDHQTQCHRRTHPKKKCTPKPGTTLPHLARNREGYVRGTPSSLGRGCLLMYSWLCHFV